MSIVPAGSENCLPIGTRLSDFEITGVLGEGGFGIVYLAFDHALQRVVAIKEYMPGVLAARGADRSVEVRAERHQDTFNVGLKSFINEARFLAQFDHPSLVKVYRYWEENQTAYTAMKYYEGRTVKEIVSGAPETVTEAWCRALVRQILDALEMLYTMNIVHRDVSPDNIIVQENGEAVLLDFGSARQIIGDRTRGLTVILKPGYAPVEQYTGDASLEQGPYTDIYALSAVIYYAIVGEPPATSIARMVKDPLVPLSIRAPQGFGTAFLSAIDRGLSVLANERPQTIDAFRALLDLPLAKPLPARPPQRIATVDKAVQTVQVRPVAVPAPQLVTIEAEPPRPRWHAKAAGGALLLAMLGAAYALLGSGDDVLTPVPAQPLHAAQPDPVKAPVPIQPSAEAPVPAQRPAAALPAPAAAAPDSAPAPEALPAKPRPAAVASATYVLAVQPWGTVYVDGRQRGASPPLKKLSLAAGHHKIKIVNPSFPDYATEVEVRAGQNAAIAHDFAATANQ